MLISFASFSQVGISTNGSFTPTSTLDVDGVINAMTSYKINNSVGSTGNFLRSNGTTGFVASNIQVSDVPTLNQNTTGSAGSLLNSLTLNNGGSGATSGTTFNGSSAVTLSYNTIGGWGLLGNSITTGTHFIGTTNNTELAFRTNNTEQMRLQSSGQLTIGATAVGAKLDVHQTTGTAVGRFTTYGNTNDLELRRSGGTQASPTSTSGAGTILGRLFGQGYNGSSYTSAASISMETDATGGTSTDMPGRIVFSTTLDGTGTLSERMRISNNGAVTLRSTSTNATFTDAGALALKQGDSNPFISFHGDAGARQGYIQSSVGTNTLTISSELSGGIRLITGGLERARINNDGALAFGGVSNTGTTGQVLTSAGSSAVPTWTSNYRFQIPYMQRFSSISASNYYLNGTNRGWNTYNVNSSNTTFSSNPASVAANFSVYYATYVATSNCTFLQFRGNTLGESLSGGQVEVRIYKYTPSNASNSAMSGTLIGSATVTLASQNFNYNIQFNGNGSASLNAGDIIVVYCRTPNHSSGTWITNVTGFLEFSY